MTTTTNQRLILVAIVAVTALGLAVTARDASRPARPSIPAAAAEEARIVCTTFSGLDRFSVDTLALEPSPDGPLQHYRVTATCKSQHQVTGTIAISAAKAASAP
jgi:hypothetical protein